MSDSRLGSFEENTIVVGDCQDIMAQMPNGCVDLGLTDPPWMVSQEVVIHRSMNPKKYKYVGKDINLDFGEWDHFENEEQYLAFTEAWIKEAVRVTKEKGHLVIFFDQNRSTQLIEIARRTGCLMRQHLYWLKSNPVPRARKVDFMVALEHACWFTKSTKSGATFNYQLGQQPNYIKCAIPGHTTKEDSDRIHPTQKPARVLKVWISYLSNEGDLVADFFAGSGTTCLVADRLNRNFFGCDISSEYVATALERLEKDRAGRQMEMAL